MQRPPRPAFGHPPWGSGPPMMNRPPPNFQRPPWPPGMSGPPGPGPGNNFMNRHRPPHQAPNRFPGQPRPPGPPPPHPGGARFGRPEGPPHPRPPPPGPPPGHQRFGMPNAPLRRRFAGPNVFNGPPRQSQPYNNTNGPNQKQNTKNKKKNTPPQGPTKANFCCDTCDRYFETETFLKEHTATHVLCKEPGCAYVAAEKLVKLHFKLQHVTGLAKKIWSLESEEDIQKWREERRKKFPTAENMAKKSALMADKEARGEVIQDKYFGKMRGRGRGRGRYQGPGRGGHRGNQGKRTSAETEEPAPCSAAKQMKTSDEPQVSGTLEEGKKTRDPDADPLSYLLEDEDLEDEETSMVIPEAGPQAAGGLGKLIANYHASSESEDEQEEEDAPEEEVGKSRQGARKQNRRRNRKPKNKQHNKQQNQSRNSKNRQPKQQRNQTDSEPQPSLLEKLLAKEIRQERNKILQCVHYIVKRNFFSENKTNTGDESKTVEGSVGSTPVKIKEDTTFTAAETETVLDTQSTDPSTSTNDKMVEGSTDSSLVKVKEETAFTAAETEKVLDTQSTATSISTNGMIAEGSIGSNSVKVKEETTFTAAGTETVLDTQSTNAATTVKSDWEDKVTVKQEVLDSDAEAADSVSNTQAVTMATD